MCEEVINVGDEIVVKAVEIDSQGRLNLSRQAALEELEAEGRPIEEQIDPEAIANAPNLPPIPPREERVGGGGRDRGRGGFGGRDRGPRRNGR